MDFRTGTYTIKEDRLYAVHITFDEPEPAYPNPFVHQFQFTSRLAVMLWMNTAYPRVAPRELPPEYAYE